MDADHVYPCHDYSLGAFQRRFAAIQGDHPANNIPPDVAIKSSVFALTGRDEDEQIQARIEPRINRMVDDDVVVMRRDYDSVIGFTESIPVFQNLNIYPGVNCSETLTTSIHLQVPFKIGGVVSVIHSGLIQVS